MVVLAYASFHDERNTRQYSWRRATRVYESFGPTSQPYARFSEGRLQILFEESSPWDFFLARHSALAGA